LPAVLTADDRRPVITAGNRATPSQTIGDETMNKTLCALSLATALSPAFASGGAGGFGENGPDTYIWAEIDVNRTTLPANKDPGYTPMNAAQQFSVMDASHDGVIFGTGRMNPELPRGSAFYGGFL
jgi:hypothetical protein